jgi:hypothetical protein
VSALVSGAVPWKLQVGIWRFIRNKTLNMVSSE